MTDSITNIESLFQSYGSKQTCVEKKEVVLKQGGIDHHIYLLKSGIMGAFFRKRDCVYAIDVFLPGQVFTSMKSFVEQTPSPYSVETITPVEYYLISHDVVNTLVKKEVNAMYLLLDQHRQCTIRMTQRIMELITMSPIERYLEFERNRPELMATLPQYVIASMIGISAESLSRIRKRLS